MCRLQRPVTRDCNPDQLQPPAPPSLSPSLCAIPDALAHAASVVPGAADPLAELALLTDRAAHYALRARGAGTLRAYRSAWIAYQA